MRAERLRGAAALLSRLRGGLRVAAAVVLTLVVAGEHWSTTRTRGTTVPAGDTIPDVYRWLAARPGSEPVADLPPRPLWFEVLLDRPRELARVEVEMAYPCGEFGRYLEASP